MPETAVRSNAGLLAGLATFVLLVGFSTTLSAGFWSPRAAILLVVGGVGVPKLVGLLSVPRMKGPAAAALAFVGWAALATAFSGNRTMALLGRYGQGTGLLFVAALAGAWAVGASLPAGGRRRVEQALVAGVVLNAAVAIVQTAVDLSSLHLDLVAQRAPGLVGNPVHLGALTAAALALVAPRLSPRLSPRTWPQTAAWAGIAVALAAGAQLSGSRSALLAMAAVVVAAAVSHGWRPGCVLAACAVIGLGAGALVAAGTGSQTAAGRAGEGESGTSARTGTWRTAVAATFHHPLLGAGPGRFDAATSPRRTLAIARAEGPDRIFTDAHNLILEYTTTTGIPGAIAGIAFAGLAVTAARGPRRAFALAVLAVGLVEPQSVVTTPIAFLALGTAAVWDPGGRQAPMGVRATSAGLAFVAAGAAAALLVGDFHLEQAKLDFGLAQASAAAAWLPPWPEPRGQLAKVYVLRSKARGADTAAEDAQARRWRTAAAERNPTEANLWNDLGDLELATGRVSSAEQHYRLALTRDPWSVRALNGAARARIAQGDPVGAGPFLRRSLLVRPAQPSIVELLHGP